MSALALNGFILLNFILIFARCEITVRPSNTEAVVGNRVVLTCKTSSVTESEFPIEWHFLPAQSTSGESLIFKDNITTTDYRERFSVVGSRNDGEYNLVIENVQLGDAGKYSCKELNVQEQAELVVFETYPSSESCVNNSPPDGVVGPNTCVGIVPDTLDVSCKMKYLGNLRPLMEWRDGEGNIVRSTRTKEGDINVSTVSQKVDRTTNLTLTCSVIYSGSEMASNLRWSTEVTVLPLQNNTVEHRTQSDNESVSCAAYVSHRSCTYSWTRGNGNVSYRHHVERLNLGGGLEHGHYTCVAVCKIRSGTCTFLPVAVEYKLRSEPIEVPSGSSLIALIVIPIVILILIIIVILLVVFRRKICKKKEDKHVDVVELRPTGASVSVPIDDDYSVIPAGDEEVPFIEKRPPVPPPNKPPRTSETPPPSVHETVEADEDEAKSDSESIPSLPPGFGFGEGEKARREEEPPEGFVMVDNDAIAK